MHIAHLVSTFPPYSGGMGGVCYYQVQELVKLGHEVSVFIPDYGPPKLKIKNAPNKLLRNYTGQEKLKIKYLKPLIKYGNAAFVPQVIKYLKDFEIIHLHWPFIGGAESVIFWAAWSKRKKIILQYHMDLVDKGLRGFVFKKYSQIFCPLIIKLARKVIVSSIDYLKNCQIKKLYYQFPEKFVEIPFGVDQEKFYPQEKKQELLRKYKINPDNQIILFVGGLDRAHYFKGLDVLIRAFKILSYKLQVTSYKLLIVGDGDLRPSHERLAKDLGIDKRVIFAGRVSDDDLPDYYNLADIFVLPSTTSSEAFGLVSLEAMACAKPIIVSDLPGPRTLVKEGINGFLVKPRDINDLAEKIKILSENNQIREKFGQNSLELIKEKYSWIAVCQKLDKLYQKV